MDLSHEDVRAILHAIADSAVDEFQLETDGLRLVVRKKATARKGVAAPVELSAAGQELRASGMPSAPAAPKLAASLTPDGPDNALEIKAPMLGTFYRSPSPGAPPFVEVGAVVAEGDTLCIIEVMKLMNSIRATVAGRIAAIFANDGEMVEYDQTVMSLEPRA